MKLQLNASQYFIGHFCHSFTLAILLITGLLSTCECNAQHCCSSHVKVNLEKGPGLFLQLPDELQTDIEPGSSELLFHSQLNYRKQVYAHHSHSLHSKGSAVNTFTDEVTASEDNLPVDTSLGPSGQSLSSSSSSSSSSSASSSPSPSPPHTASTSDTFRYFTLLHLKNAVTVRASLGPLNVKKTLYPSSLSSQSSPSIDHTLNKQVSLNPTIDLNSAQHMPLQGESQLKEHTQSSHQRNSHHRNSFTGSSAFSELDPSSKSNNLLHDHPSSTHHHHQSNHHSSSKSGQRKGHTQQHAHASYKIQPLDMETASRQIKAHLISNEVMRNKPILRILFHSTFAQDSNLHLHSYTHHSHSMYNEHTHEQMCVIVAATDSSKSKMSVSMEHTSIGEDTVYSFCSLNDASSTCITSAILPPSWFPPVSVDSTRASKGSMVKVSYTLVRSTVGCNESTLASIDPIVSPFIIKSLSKDVIDALTRSTSVNVFNHIADVPLYPFRLSYEEVTADDMVKILVPQVPIYPLTYIYIPVVFKVNPSYPVAAFSVRIRIKSGLRVIGAILSPNCPWSISLEVSPKGNAATVTAHLKDDDDSQMMSQSSNVTLNDSDEDIVDTENKSVPPASVYDEDYLSDAATGKWSKEQLAVIRRIQLLDRMGTNQVDVFSWLLQVEHLTDTADNGRVVWQIIYLNDSPNSSPHRSSSSSITSHSTGSFASASTVDSSKLTTRFDIRKDEVEKLIGLTSTSEILNTAVLTGKQISNLLKIYAVSFSGKVGDVTLQSSCHSIDESVIKVSPSCSSVYLDGTETRGSFNASIWIKYGSTYTGMVSFKIWIPKFPLEMYISDTKLSTIKSWKIPNDLYKSSHHPHRNFDDTDDFQSIQSKRHRGKRNLRSRSKRAQALDFDTGDNTFTSSSCRLKYQQAYISLSSKFTATDSKNGREAYYISRRASFNVDHLVSSFVRVSDARIAYLYTTYSGHLMVEGLANGRTDVQVVSPITGAILSKRDIKVAPDKESITRLEVSLATGLNLNVTKLPSLNGGFNSYYTVKVTTNLNYFTSKFQEGFLITQIFFSDGTSVYLNDVEAANYFLTIDLFDNNALAVVPPVNSPSVGTGDVSSGHNGNFNDGKFYYPRVIALSHGKDQLIHIALEMPLMCQRKRTQQLALKYLNVNIDLVSAIQNDYKDNYQAAHSGKNFKINLNNKFPSNKDHNGKDDSVSSDRNTYSRDTTGFNNRKKSNAKSNWRFIQGNGGDNRYNGFPSPMNGRGGSSNGDDEDRDVDTSLNAIFPSMSPLEMGIYAVVSFFTIAVMIFVTSCMIFTFKGKPHHSNGDNEDLSNEELDNLCSNNAVAAISMASAAGVAIASSKCKRSTRNDHLMKQIIDEPQCSALKPPPIPIRTTSQSKGNFSTLDNVDHCSVMARDNSGGKSSCQLLSAAHVTGHQLTNEREKRQHLTPLRFTSEVTSHRTGIMNEEDSSVKHFHSMSPRTPLLPLAQDWVFLGRATLERSNHQTQSTGRLVLSPHSVNDVTPYIDGTGQAQSSNESFDRRTSIPDNLLLARGKNGISLESISSSNGASLNHSPLSSLDNLSSLLLSNHSLTSVIDKSNSSMSLEPSSEHSANTRGQSDESEEDSDHTTPAITTDVSRVESTSVKKADKSLKVKRRQSDRSSLQSTVKKESHNQTSDQSESSPLTPIELHESYKCNPLIADTSGDQLCTEETTMKSDTSDNSATRPSQILSRRVSSPARVTLYENKLSQMFAREDEVSKSNDAKDTVDYTDDTTGNVRHSTIDDESNISNNLSCVPGEAIRLTFHQSI